MLYHGCFDITMEVIVYHGYFDITMEVIVKVLVFFHAPGYDLQ